MTSLRLLFPGNTSSPSPTRRRRSYIKTENDDAEVTFNEDVVTSSNNKPAPASVKKLRRKSSSLKLRSSSEASDDLEDDLEDDTTPKRQLRTSDRPRKRTLRNGVASMRKLSVTIEKIEVVSEDESPRGVRGRRTELAKLLEAGSSSFHCATAKEVSNGVFSPIHIEVGSSRSSEEDNSLLLTTSDDLQKKRGRKRKTEAVTSPTSSFKIPRTTFDELDRRLRDVTGDPPEDVDDLHFSFEVTPFREGWFQTYSRQDQGDEIFYYPDGQTFPLPYEMPISTFYYLGDKPPGKAKLEKMKENDEATEVVRRPRGRPPARKKLPLQGQPGRKDSKTSTDSDASSMIRKLGPRIAKSVLLNNSSNFSRKSPRCHASTKSLLSVLDDKNLEDCSNDSSLFELASSSAKVEKVRVFVYQIFH